MGFDGKKKKKLLLKIILMKKINLVVHKFYLREKINLLGLS